MNKGEEKALAAKLKIYCPLENIRSLVAKTGDGQFHKGGEMIIVGDTIGVVAEDVGPLQDFVLVYEAEKIVLPKALGSELKIGNWVYYDSEKKVVCGEIHDIPIWARCGIVLENASCAESEVVIHLRSF